MSCQSCGSIRNQLSNGEVAIHFTGRDGLTKPIVWVFPKLIAAFGRSRVKYSLLYSRQNPSN
jgi:hypothetical protein